MKSSSSSAASLRSRLASTYLFVGPTGVGKRTFALKLAQCLLCRVNPPEAMNPCGRCEACVQMLAGTHPDLLQVRKPIDKNEIPIDALVGPRERRMQEGLCHDLWQKPQQGSRRIAIIDDADALNEESANCLLKTLEEPPPRAVIVLIGTSPQRQLPTIRSRSQIVRFSPLERETIARLLASQQTVETPAEAERIAAHSHGSLARATELLDVEYWTFREAWLQRLSASNFDSLAAAAALIALAEAAGKESSARRGRIRQAIELTVDFYSVLAKAIAGSELQEDDDVAKAVALRSATWRGGEDVAIDATERSLDAREQLDRYGHQATVVECWLDDLARIHELAFRG